MIKPFMTNSSKVSNDSVSPQLAFVQVKSFGDLTIVCKSLRNLTEEMRGRCLILIAPHLFDLACMLAPGCMVETLAFSENGVPSIFDLKKKGLFAGLRSALSLRKALLTAAPNAMLIMQRSALRERFIAGPRHFAVLPKTDNIYLAYKHFLDNQFHCNLEPIILSAVHCSNLRVAICPFSRVKSKNLPVKLIEEVATNCRLAGFKPELLLLEGEDTLELASNVEVRILPRRFDILADALAEYSGVISADSLPAHLAEYRGTSAFVVTPEPNTYWLPLHSFQGRYWGVIGQPHELIAQLRRFLVSILPR